MMLFLMLCLVLNLVRSIERHHGLRFFEKSAAPPAESAKGAAVIRACPKI